MTGVHAALHLPCLATNGIKIFTPTADQRFLAGDFTAFLSTHFPIQFQHHRANTVTTISERNVLENLLHPDSAVIGNRIMIFYGAAGSGKSEFMRWLQTQITVQDKDRAEVLLRISRTDLDIFHIIQRIQQHYHTASFQSRSQQRWHECRQKPRTLAKILVLTALEQILDSDEQINALYYQLIDVVQANLEQCFTIMDLTLEERGTSLELFSRENLKEIVRTSVIPVPIEYEVLRFHMLKVFKDQLLEGLDLPSLLKQIAQHTQHEREQRPILIIDDLVQSMNFFATDLLDYFITLEEGCWDILIGITPNSLETTLRGKELLDRINFLDTIDDRVHKLWLSDEYGLVSSFLDETNCAEYARLYLSQFKQQNKQPCDPSCPAFQHCQLLEPDRSHNLLAPFNKEALIRLFRSLPPEKGKVRYFTLYLRDILEKAARGEDPLTVLQQYIRSEQAVNHTNQRLTLVHEFYGPLAQKGETLQEDQQITQLYQFFGIHKGEEQPVVVPLLKLQVAEQHKQEDLDPGKEAIKHWLRGEAINKQQLRHLRRGVVKSIKNNFEIDMMTRLHTAKPSRSLRCARTRMETIPPIALENVDDFDGLPLPRTIGSLAYLFYDFADTTTGRAEQILEHPHFPPLLFQAFIYRERMHSELTQQIGMQVEELAFALFVFAAMLHQIPAQLPPAIHAKVPGMSNFFPHYPKSLEADRPLLSTSQLGIIQRLFDDCFKLRENVYDGHLLEQLSEALSPEQAVELLQHIDTTHLSSDFKLNEQPLSTLLQAVQSTIQSLNKLKKNPKAKATLVFICKAGLKQDSPSQQLAELLGLPGEIEQVVEKFFQSCSSLELHYALTLAYCVDRAQYEDTLLYLQVLLEAEEHLQPDRTRMLLQNFTKLEIDTLASLTEENFRIPVSQIDPHFIVKVSHHLPELYKRLEICLQRG